MEPELSLIVRASPVLDRSTVAIYLAFSPLILIMSELKLESGRNISGNGRYRMGVSSQHRKKGPEVFL